MTFPEAALSLAAPISNGKKIEFHQAKAAHENYWETVSNDALTGDQCPKLVLFSLRALQNYLQQASAAFDKMGIPEEQRGIAVLPLIHEGQQRFNVMLTPCLKNIDSVCHHQFNNSADPGDDPYEWVLEAFNEGQLWP